MTASPTFGELLRQHRLTAGLTQEALAERAGLSVHGIQKLERGVTRPYRDTVQRLLRALRLPPEDEAELLAAAEPAPRPMPRRHVPDAGVARQNLPLPVSSFIGREQELIEVRRLLGSTRLLTLAGAGGIGKTRLALEVARAVAADAIGMFPDGVWLVRLEVLTDPGLVTASVASVLNIRERPGCSLLETITSSIGPRNVLLVLDNCEHLLDPCAEMAVRLLQTCPKLHLLVTSREPLNVTGETSWRVPPLATPDQELMTAEQLLSFEAARLFVERAQAARADFSVTDQNASAVSRVCRRLDGLPLAIELAAARVKALSVEQVAQRLDNRFQLLTGSGRAAPPRHQTLRTAIDWSYDLLSKAEQELFRRLAVFAGSWTLESS